MKFLLGLDLIQTYRLSFCPSWHLMLREFGDLSGVDFERTLLAFKIIKIERITSTVEVKFEKLNKLFLPRVLPWLRQREDFFTATVAAILSI